jgi:NAD(P)-dependent dehydrogenase (short-subunit alcohol dehydrogenase family)
VRHRASAEDTVAATIEEFGRLDILVNNAQSSKPFTQLEDMSQEDIELTIESGLMGTLYHMLAALPHMKQRGGSIVNVGSREGIMGSAGFGIYAATKEAIRGLSRSAAREWGRYNIRVNVICPAAVSPASEQFFADHPDMKDHYLNQIALGRLGDPATDIGSAVVFLASAESAYVTGQTINVDGGQVML